MEPRFDMPPGTPITPVFGVAPAKRPPSKKRLIIAVAAGTLFLSAAAAAFFYPPSRSALMSAASRVTLALGIGKIPEPVTTPPEPTPRDRDMERYADVSALRLALVTYQSDARSYPERLDDLVPKYLPSIGSDPSTGRPYHYVNAPTGYTISFSLEEGAVGMAPGDHFLTPNGFDEPLSEAASPTETAAPTQTAQVEVEPENPLPTIITKDSDGDGILDDDERPFFGTSPALADSDGDGTDDGEEALAGTDPTEAVSRLTDTDADGLADAYERYRKFDPEDPDMDKDGVADGDELRVFRTDPQKKDSDGDGFGDGDELRKGYDPNGAGALSGTQREAFDAAGTKYGYHEPTSRTLNP